MKRYCIKCSNKLGNHNKSGVCQNCSCIEQPCLNCGKIVINKKYCDASCEMKHIHLLKGHVPAGTTYKKICEWCHKKFKAKKEKVKFCSMSCVISHKNITYKRTNSETRNKRASKTMKKLFKDGKLHLKRQHVSKSCTLFLNKLESIYNVKIKREHRLDGRFFDGKYKNILIESDSDYFHSFPERIKADKLKNKIALNNEFNLYRFIVNSTQQVDKVINENKQLLNKIFER